MIILINARIYTFSEEFPVATALAIDGDRIIAVGEAGEILARYKNKGEEMYCDGLAVIPGLVDSHIHLEQYALSLQRVDCETGSKSECLLRVEEQVSRAQPGEWILGHGWNQNNWLEGYGSLQDLDGLAPRNPVFLTAKSLHAAWVNSLAFDRAGIPRESEDPPNGLFGRDSQGSLNGIIFENAISLVEKVIPAPSVELVAASIRQAQADLWKKGITGGHDFDRSRCFAALQILHSRGELHLRVLKSIPYENITQAIELGLRSGFGDDFLRIGGIKIFADGALGPRTAAMLLPYESDPDNKGLSFVDREQLFEIGQQAVDSGLALAVHAIGDRANHEVLDGLERLRGYERSTHSQPVLPHRIEHVQILHPDDVPRLSELGVVASMQPIHAISDMEMADQYWGNRSRWSYAFKSQIDFGARLVFGSDAPVESPNPFLGVYAAVTRRRLNGEPGENGWYPEQKLSVQQALEAYTLQPAAISGMGDRAGRIAPGYLADLLVLDHDPFKCQPGELHRIKPLKTMVAGKWVFEA